MSSPGAQRVSSMETHTGHGAAVMTCTVCDGREFQAEVYGVLSRCQGCGHVFAPELPAMAPARLYNEDYFTVAEYVDYAAQYQTLAKNFNTYLRLMRRYGATHGRLFEVGAAYGFFLNEARRSFDVEGIDVSAEATAFGRERFALPLHCGDFTAFEPTEPYRVVCLWDTLEHLCQPGEYVAKVHEILGTDGHFFLTTGDIGSLVPRIQGHRWRLIHPPTHLHYFSWATITRLLHRHGFEGLQITTVGLHRELRAMLHGLSLFSRSRVVRTVAGALAERAKALLGHASVSINLFDIMFVAARKRAGPAHATASR